PRAPQPSLGARPGGQRSDGQPRQGRHTAAAGWGAARAPLRGRGAVSGGAARGRRAPPAPQVCEPELSADVLRRIESGAAPLVLHADVRGAGQSPRLLSAPPAWRPSCYRQPVTVACADRRRSTSPSGWCVGSRSVIAYRFDGRRLLPSTPEPRVIVSRS